MCFTAFFMLLFTIPHSHDRISIQLCLGKSLCSQGFMAMILYGHKSIYGHAISQPISESYLNYSQEKSTNYKTPRAP